MNEILNEAPFAAKVKYLRAKLMLTQEALAKELGVSFATVNRWESQCRLSLIHISEPTRPY